MVERKHRSGSGRLIAAVAALALVLAQLLGAYAHAAGHDHATGQAACAHLDDHHAAVAHGGDQEAPDRAHQHDDNRALHSASCDFLCHGGIAILATSAFEYLDPAPPYASAIAAVVDPASPPSLERPPRSSARA